MAGRQFANVSISPWAINPYTGAGTDTAKSYYAAVTPRQQQQYAYSRIVLPAAPTFYHPAAVQVVGEESDDGDQAAGTLIAPEATQVPATLEAPPSETPEASDIAQAEDQVEVSTETADVKDEPPGPSSPPYATANSEIAAPSTPTPPPPPPTDGPDAPTTGEPSLSASAPPLPPPPVDPVLVSEPKSVVVEVVTSDAASAKKKKKVVVGKGKPNAFVRIRDPALTKTSAPPPPKEDKQKIINPVSIMKKTERRGSILSVSSIDKPVVNADSPTPSIKKVSKPAAWSKKKDDKKARSKTVKKDSSPPPSDAKSVVDDVSATFVAETIELSKEATPETAAIDDTPLDTPPEAQLDIPKDASAPYEPAVDMSAPAKAAPSAETDGPPTPEPATGTETSPAEDAPNVDDDNSDAVSLSSRQTSDSGSVAVSETSLESGDMPADDSVMEEESVPEDAPVMENEVTESSPPPFEPPVEVVDSTESPPPPPAEPDLESEPVAEAVSVPDEAIADQASTPDPVTEPEILLQEALIVEAPAPDDAAAVAETAASSENTTSEEAADAVEATPNDEATTAVEDTTGSEDAVPEVPNVIADEVPALPAHPLEEEGPSVVDAPGVDEFPAIEESMAVEKTPIVEDVSVVEQIPAAVNDSPTIEDSSTINETPAVDETSTVDETPVIEEAPVADENPINDEMPLSGPPLATGALSASADEPETEEAILATDAPSTVSDVTVDLNTSEALSDTPINPTEGDTILNNDEPKNEEQSSPDPAPVIGESTTNLEIVVEDPEANTVAEDGQQPDVADQTEEASPVTNSPSAAPGSDDQIVTEQEDHQDESVDVTDTAIATSEHIEGAEAVAEDSTSQPEAAAADVAANSSEDQSASEAVTKSTEDSANHAVHFVVHDGVDEASVVSAEPTANGVESKDDADSKSDATDHEWSKSKPENDEESSLPAKIADTSNDSSVEVDDEATASMETTTNELKAEVTKETATEEGSDLPHGEVDTANAECPKVISTPDHNDDTAGDAPNETINPGVNDDGTISENAVASSPDSEEQETIAEAIEVTETTPSVFPPDGTAEPIVPSSPEEAILDVAEQAESTTTGQNGTTADENPGATSEPLVEEAQIEPKTIHTDVSIGPEAVTVESPTSENVLADIPESASSAIHDTSATSNEPLTPESRSTQAVAEETLDTKDESQVLEDSMPATQDAPEDQVEASQAAPPVVGDIEPAAQVKAPATAADVSTETPLIGDNPPEVEAGQDQNGDAKDNNEATYEANDSTELPAELAPNEPQPTQSNEVVEIVKEPEAPQTETTESPDQTCGTYLFLLHMFSFLPVRVQSSCAFPRILDSPTHAASWATMGSMLQGGKPDWAALTHNSRFRQHTLTSSHLYFQLHFRYHHVPALFSWVAIGLPCMQVICRKSRHA
ncbi:hypothetical protein T440DRAFT_246895 [Plenodomus tracheiphilus IPT5]|uniref:Uncharacterized protein n=1 Tax=Plenodomus tracheiphilus IPT5 TaxID=1408161 RepID=A0A6A7ASI2_9PLEO|nr:hypothetical protein T440DRAFT_246895 [Plenodomus tracheiphilus IPT5]